MKFSIDKFSVALVVLLTLGVPWSVRALNKILCFDYVGQKCGRETSPNAWHHLVPLLSTRADVERLLGKPKMAHGSTYIYKTEDERVDVLYSVGGCELSGVEKWNVPKDTIIRMEVTQNRKQLIQDLHLNKEKYVRIQETHPDNWVQYWNTEDGIIVHTILNGQNEEVFFITYEPTAKDKPLRCN